MRSHDKTKVDKKDELLKPYYEYPTAFLIHHTCERRKKLLEEYLLIHGDIPRPVGMFATFELIVFVDITCACSINLIFSFSRNGDKSIGR
jgi:hypothetical protein